MRPIVLLLAAALVAACGSDGDGELSAEAYRERANELCAEAEDRIAKIDAPRSANEVAGYLERALELSREYDRRFRELDPPQELEPLHDRGVRLSRRLDERFEDLIDDVRGAAEPVRELQRGLQRMLDDIREADELNRRLKLDECLDVPGLGGSAPGPS